MKTFSCVIFILFFVSLTNIAVFAQEQAEEGNVYAISTWKIRFDQIDDFLDAVSQGAIVFKQGVKN